jgi:ISXO2 transposase-like protein
LRLQVIADVSADSLHPFVKATTASGAIVHTDGWQGYAGLSKLGYDHRPRSKRAAPPGEQLLPPHTARSPTSKSGCLAARHPPVGLT